MKARFPLMLPPEFSVLRIFPDKLFPPRPGPSAKRPFAPPTFGAWVGRFTGGRLWALTGGRCARSTGGRCRRSTGGRCRRSIGGRGGPPAGNCGGPPGGGPNWANATPDVATVIARRAAKVRFRWFITWLPSVLGATAGVSLIFFASAGGRKANSELDARAWVFQLVNSAMKLGWPGSNR